jgi:ATP-dependent exoDNAse (exonuclease V) beta subunit
MVEVSELGDRISIQVKGDDGMRDFGEAVHGFLAADRLAHSADEREAMAEGLLKRWNVAGAIETADLLVVSERLTTWVEANWPGARWRREWPVEQRLEGGTILRGTADLVLETEVGFVLIDHKSFPGSREQAERRAVEYAGQLAAYAGVLEAASGTAMLGSYIHLPVSGLMVQVDY